MTSAPAQAPARVFEDVSIGDLIGPVSYGPLTVMHLMRWGAAMENWHRIHYDTPFAAGHEGLPGPLVNGTWKQQVMAQLLKDWSGHGGWVRALTFRFRGMDVAGETLHLQGRVTSAQASGGVGEVGCELEMRNRSGEVTTSGAGTVLLPLRSGPAVPYPVRDLEQGRPAGTSRDGTSRAALSESSARSSAGQGGHYPQQYASYIGRDSGPLVSADVVDASSVRRFMQAIMTDDSDCYDPAGPGAARYGSVVASPLYPLNALHVPAGAADPLDQARADPDFDGASQTPWSSFGLPELPGAPSRILNAGNSVELFAYAPLGCRIEVSSSYESIQEKAGRSGPLLFLTVASRYRVHETGLPLLASRQTTILR